MNLKKDDLNRSLLDGLTEHQKAAVMSQGGSVIISAGAGSGKTSVLSRRAVYKIADPVNGCDADKLLIITFSRAAAAEMKSRINELFDMLFFNFPEDKRLERQQILLQKAQICTIDSFCAGLIRANFSLLGISPNFKTADESELRQIHARAIDEVFNSYYTRNDPRFLSLAEYFYKDGDSVLEKIILDIYGTVRTNPFPRVLLRKLSDDYKKNSVIEETVWKKVLLEEANYALNHAVCLMDAAIKTAREDALAWECYGKGLAANMETLSELLFCEGEKSTKEESYNELYAKIRDVTFCNIGRAKSGLDPVLAKQIKTLHTQARDTVKKTISENIIFCSPEEFKEDMEFLHPKISMLCEITERFWDAADKLKESESLLDFSDIGHLALSLLVKPTGEKTRLAADLSEKYDEIMLDEYQDTNRLQDLFFTVLSKNEKNLFMVGDVKQCIYEFRRARADIFLQKYRSFNKYDEKTARANVFTRVKTINYPAAFTLSENFRSGKEVCGAVNYIFSQICSPYLGELEYDESQYLSAGFFETEQNQADTAELHIIEYNKTPEKELFVKDEENPEQEESLPTDKTELEAKHIAAKVKHMLNSRYMIKDRKNGTLRPCRPGDFAVLLRAYKDKGEKIAGILNNAGIRASFGQSKNFFAAREISLILNLLRVIDNPLNDMAMTAVLLSEIGGISADELVGIRFSDMNTSGGNVKMKQDKKFSSMYRCLLTASKEQKKAEEFISLLSSFRRFAAKNSLEKLINHIYEIMFLPVMTEALQSGYGQEEISQTGQVRANLRLLLTYAKNYEKNGRRGLTGFLQFAAGIMESGTDIESANISMQTEDTVAVMSIHNSKGLEFPVVFVSDCHRDFYFGEKDPKHYIDDRMGLSVKCIKPDEFLEYKNIPYRAAQINARKRQMSEEIRILYVASTRAAQKLIFTGVTEDTERRIRNLTTALKNIADRKLSPYMVSQSVNYLDWLLLALLRAPSCQNLRGDLPLCILPFNETDNNCEHEIRSAIFNAENITRSYQEILEKNHISNEKNIAENQDSEESDAVNKRLREQQARMEFTYPYPGRYLPAKLSVTEIVKSGTGMALRASGVENMKNAYSSEPEYTLTSRPSFVRQDSAAITATEKGQALHSFMQYADFQNAIKDLEKEIERLTALKFISPVMAASLERRLIKQFLVSKPAAMMQSAENVLREFPFVIRVPAKDILPDVKDISYINVDANRNFNQSTENPKEYEAENILVQGVIDCVIQQGTEPESEIIIVDYKTDRVREAVELIQRYSDQISLYRTAAQAIFNTKNIKCYIYSLHLGKEISV
ncbi:MAG: helicase-exonuclease AddAB subunit AddA [Oscillospiraceae bacterium]|nr:helicase-exonuclease AddAB subunit AddA [Oscillospiraceae bacterium]